LQLYLTFHIHTMNHSKNGFQKIAPVFFSFIVMGFVDIIGVATGYIKHDFQLNDFTAQFFPMMVLLWFFCLSVPVGILQDRFGKRNMLNIGMIIQALGLGLPFFNYSYGMMFASFIFLGIGNTIIQVSANPLLQDVSPAHKLASYMSTSQFIKAIISFSGPLIAAFLAAQFGDWKLVFAIYGITSLLAALWLSMTPIKESKPERKPASFSSCFGLLKNRFVALMALSIFLIVGSEVAINTNITNILIARYNLVIGTAAIGISVFFAGETISRFLGAIIMNWIKPRLFLLLTTLVSLLGISALFIAPGNTMAFVSIFIIGLGIGNMFPIIFSLALAKIPERANEISGLLIMSVSGGAVIPVVMGLVSSLAGPVASITVIGICMIYILWVSFYVGRIK
jgi:MFS transporter, FHS family, L-fucose permease